MKKYQSKNIYLSTSHPELCKEWHPTLNGLLTPENVTAGSGKKVWWKCSKDNTGKHVWQATIGNRTIGTGCPFCDPRKLTSDNCLAVTHPELAKQWHQELNGNLTPYDVKAMSGRKVYWKCEVADDHVWISKVHDRTRGQGCPCCSGRQVSLRTCLATVFPEYAKKWHPTLNGDLTPYDVSAYSHKKVYWQCDKCAEHVWKQKVQKIARGRGCQYCAQRLINSSNCLATLHPQLAKDLLLFYYKN